MHKLIGAACHRTAGMAAGLVLTGGLVGGVLLTPGTAYAQTTVDTTTAITGTSQTSTFHGTTLNVQVSVTPASGTTAPDGTVKVTAGWGSCFLTLAQEGSTAVSGGNCNIYNLSPGTYAVTASYGGSSSFGSSDTSASVTIGSAPVFNADSPSLNATPGQGYSYTFHAYGSPAPSYTLGAGSPSWLHIDSYTGTVWGTVPFWARSFSYSVTASNSVGSATAGPYTVYVQPQQRHVNISTYLSCTSRVYTGQRGSCTLWVTNNGYNSAPNVNAQIALPSQLRADYCGYFWSFGCSISNNTASENLGTLNPGQTKALTVVFTARNGFTLFGWHHGWRFTVKVVGSASSYGNWWFLGQRSSYSVAWVTIVPRGIWW
jgi:hypothetical protein